MGAVTGREDPVLDDKEHKTLLADQKMKCFAHGSIWSVSKMFVSTEVVVDGRKLQKVKPIFDFNSGD
jgi:hypothetical protein